MGDIITDICDWVGRVVTKIVNHKLSVQLSFRQVVESKNLFYVFINKEKLFQHFFSRLFVSGAVNFDELNQLQNSLNVCN